MLKNLSGLHGLFLVPFACHLVQTLRGDVPCSLGVAAKIVFHKNALPKFINPYASESVGKDLVVFQRPLTFNRGYEVASTKP